MIFIVLVSEGDMILAHLRDPGVSYGNPVSIPPQVFKNTA